jgi:predicted alpha/beta hydrolase
VHWGQADRTEFLSEALILARAGAESLLIDGVFNRPGGQADDFTHPEKEKQGYIQLLTDIRRGVDLLQSRPEVNGKRIAYVGHSYGATWGGALAGVEHRIIAYVLMGRITAISRTTSGFGNKSRRSTRTSRSTLTKKLMRRWSRKFLSAWRRRP